MTKSVTKQQLIKSRRKMQHVKVLLKVNSWLGVNGRFATGKRKWKPHFEKGNSYG